MSAAVLVGDVGGTNARFALARRGPEGIGLDAFRKLPGDDYGSFEDALAAYLADTGIETDAALFALAGPVSVDQTVELTNRAWPLIEADALASRFNLRALRLVNDFAAMARAVPEMPAGNFVSILAGDRVPEAPILVTGPGTGFGIATLLTRPDGGYRVMTGEGGFATYAATNELERVVQEALAAEHGFVCNEMVVSGKWLAPVHRILCAHFGVPYKPAFARDLLRDAAAGDEVAREVCLLRAAGAMSAAGDAALITGARGGVVMTGGVAERITDWLRHPEAVRRFRQRGSHSDYMAHLPVSVLVGNEAPLIGAAALHFDEEALP